MTQTTLNTPTVQWAQHDNCVFLTYCLEDTKDPTVKIESNSIYFRGVGGADKKEYELKIELNGEVDPATSEYHTKVREVDVILKKTKDGYWPRLLKGPEKHHWLKIDFGKWKEEDGSDDEAPADMGGMGGFPGMGGMGGGMGGMPGMGGMGGMGGMMGGMPGMDGGMDYKKMMEDMGGLGGLGGGSKPGFDDMNDTDSDDDEALPELE